MVQQAGRDLEEARKSSFQIALICTTSRRIQASASTNQRRFDPALTRNRGLERTRMAQQAGKDLEEARQAEVARKVKYIYIYIYIFLSESDNESYYTNVLLILA